MTDYRFSDSPSGPTLFDQPVEPPSVAVDTSMDAGPKCRAGHLLVGANAGRRRDGRLRCRECGRRQCAAWRERHRAHVLQYGKQYAKAHPEDRLACKQVWRKRHPVRHRAHMAVSYALRTGDLVRQPCAVCGNPKSEAHHRDYTKPLEVEWFCRQCHAAHHRRLGAAKRGRRVA